MFDDFEAQTSTPSVGDDLKLTTPELNTGGVSATTI